MKIIEWTCVGLVVLIFIAGGALLYLTNTDPTFFHPVVR